MLTVRGDGFHRTVKRTGYGGYDNRMFPYMVSVEMDVGGGVAIFVGGGMKHVYLFLAAHARHYTVIAHAYKQTASYGVGEGGDTARQLPGIGHLVFEILLFMLAFGYELVDVSAVVHLVRLFFLGAFPPMGPPALPPTVGLVLWDCMLLAFSLLAVVLLAFSLFGLVFLVFSL